MNKIKKTVFLFSILQALLFGPLQSNAQDTGRVPAIQDLCWSPDGKMIYFSGMWHAPNYSDFRPENWSIYKYDFENKTVVEFIDSAYYVAVSPSGEHIATGEIRGGNRDLCIYDSNGKNAKRLTSHPSGDYLASFSPDGQKILFNSSRNGKPDIYVMNIDSTGLTRLTFTASDSSYNSPQWSPDGEKIVFFMGTPNRKDQVFVMNADGSNLTNITNDTLHNFYPSWRSNNEIIYTSVINGTNYIYTITADGKKRKQLFAAESFYARISPNGKMIAYVDSKEHCIKVITLKGKLIESICLPKE